MAKPPPPGPAPALPGSNSRDADEPDLRALARAHTEAAIQALVAALTDERDRVRAAAALLDRGWGRPAASAGSGPDTSYLDLLASLGPDDTPQYDQAGGDSGAGADPGLARLPGPVRPPGPAGDA